MGAKQSKRSVDISGKEAEGAGEVAAAGAGGEGRVEPLADADALKPQLNGDAHIHEQTDKEKQLDSGTPENEKDATTEKEGKEEVEKEKEAVPVINGDSEPKAENGETAPAGDDTKKPKKEKVKKKWSLRSISFSRKDKPKQEKKLKEEEPKTNGEPEKVPEEAAEATTEVVTNETAEEKKPEVETNDEKTPETPVTEPLTNGSSTPESPKVEIPVVEEIPVPTAPVEPAEAPKPEPEPEVKPEQLPVNGLSLEESKPDVTEIIKSEESKPEEPAAETRETVPAPEIPVKKEVCVEQMPLESPPPPLPANPPPSSVASFAASTMAPELPDASLSNTALPADTHLPHTALSDTKTDINDTVDVTTTESTDLPPPLKETLDSKTEETKVVSDVDKSENTESPVDDTPIPEPKEEHHSIPMEVSDDQNPGSLHISSTVDNHTSDTEPVQITAEPLQVIAEAVQITAEPAQVTPELETEDLPPPPPVDDLVEMEECADDTPQENINNINESVVNSNHLSECINQNGVNDERQDRDDETEQENLKNKLKGSIEKVDNIECNGNLVEEDPKDETETIPAPLEVSKTALSAELEQPLPSAEGAEAAADALPPPPPELSPRAATPQDPVPVSDKIADLIPEVPVVPDLNNETLQETTSDVAVAN